MIEVLPTDDVDALRRLGVAAGIDPGRGEPKEDIVLAWGAYDGDRLIGGVTLEWFAGLYLVSWLSVVEECRRQGVGHLLLETLERGALDLGVGELWATARTPGFFMRQGYSVAGGGGEREVLLPGCEGCPQYETTCHPKIVKKALAAEAES